MNRKLEEFLNEFKTAVIEKHNIRWKEMKFKDKLMDFIIEISVSKRLFFANLKKEGRVLYGEDVLKLINAEPTFADSIFMEEDIKGGL